MKGDFSRLPDERNENFAGVLHQQGRVLLDADWNAQTAITTGWQDTAGRDVIGAGVAAVPADEQDGFKIVSAAHAAGTTDVQLTVNTGRVWADGLLARVLDEANPLATSVARTATYLTPPVQDPPFDTTSIAIDKRDAVILEVWREEFNGFQRPDLLIEPALGGPDTTERVNTAFAFRLMRLADGDTCENISARLKDDFSKKGKLKVTLRATVSGGSLECPTPAGGGYTGFEHSFYRIEIAAVNPGPAQFKWSQYGGGLVGRGRFDAAAKTVTIKDNLQAITNSGLSGFYLEALERDPARGHWRVSYGAPATLSGDVLALGTAVFQTIPANPDPNATVFFRLWNGIEPVQAFANAELPDHLGIMLAFDGPAASNYVPGDYWTFSVRAGEVVNPEVLVNTEPPKGIHYHRVPLAVITWASNQDPQLPIEDCRHRFQPLTRLGCCCSYRVGDGMHTWGDFDKIQDAVNALPPEGGEICVLAGIYDESVLIDERVSIRIHGCGPDTRVRAVVGDDGAALPAFMISNSSAIMLEDIAIESGPASAVHITNARNVTVARCLIQMRDQPTLWQAIFSRGDDVLIDSNIIEVLPRTGIPPEPTVPPKLGSPRAPAGVYTLPDPIVVGGSTRGGIQLAGGSDRVRVVHNIIRGGIWNGITLGSLEVEGSDGDDDTPDGPASEDPCDPCKPVDLTEEEPNDDNVRFVSAGDLYDIEIAGNRITDMGINGIGVVRFFDLTRLGDFIGVHGLHIADNFIARCMRRDSAQIRQSMLSLVAYGGIALAKVSDLRVLRNEIVANGASHLQPICGVFAIIAQGVVIDDNRILDNGPRSPAPVENAQNGIRGGVHIWLVLPIVEQQIVRVTPAPPRVVGAAPAASHVGPTLAASHIGPTAAASPAGPTPATSRVSLRSAFNGVSACSMRDNVIVSPLGRAVTFFALGTVVVARNRLVTQGSTRRGLDLIAATVLIGNAGLSNEWTLGLILVFILRLLGKTDNTQTDFCIPAKYFGLVKPTRPVSPWPPLVQEWATGKTLFTENQVTLDLIDDEAFGIHISSILVLTLDDLGMTDNQCEVTTTNVFCATDALLLGGSVRVADNRLSETWMRAIYSAVSFGIMNTTTDNQSTHCLLARASLPILRMFKHNLAFIRAFCPGECGDNGYGELN
ncbi:MAG TPA: DUF6519 domain-containing protein [Gemmatimonadaceae bacterium]|nr:DUF6519 domain-containing protein [Gemmatimonadaceae bacterium]